MSKKLLSIFDVLDWQSESERKLRKTGNILVVLFIEKINYISEVLKEYVFWKTHFILVDKLPTVHDAAILIFEVAAQSDQKKNVSVPAKYSKLQHSQTRKKCKYTYKKLCPIKKQGLCFLNIYYN